MKQLQRTLLLLAVGICLALGVYSRTHDLAGNPAGFFCDEANAGLNAFRILHDGRDIIGHRFPLIFNFLRDGKFPVFVYSAVPSVAVLGLSETAVRMTSAIYGILAILAIFLLTRRLFNLETAIWASVFLCLSPWHIFLSRIGFETSTAVFWFTISVYLGHKCLFDHRFYPFACLVLALALLSYPATVLVVLPFFCLMVLLFWHEAWNFRRSRAFWITNILGLAAASFIILPWIRSGDLLARWHSLHDSFPPLKDIVVGYARHFSVDFLFRTGDIDFPGQNLLRHSVRGIGQLYTFQIPLLIVGLAYLLTKNVNRQTRGVVLALLLLFPFGGALVSTQPFATRSCLGVIPLQMISAIGVTALSSYFEDKRKPSLWRVAVSITTLVSFFRFFGLLQNYPSYSSGYYGWQFGYRDGVELATTKRAEYDEIYISQRFDASIVLLMFYRESIPCEKCRVQTGPLPIKSSKKQYFIIRPEEQNDVRLFNPKLTFKSDAIIRGPDDFPELLGGVFEENNAAK